MKLSTIQLGKLMDQAHSLAEEGKYLHAIQLYNRLVNSGQPFRIPYLKLAALYAERGQLSAAVEILQRADNLFPLDAVIIERLGDYYLRMEEYDNAIGRYKKLAQMKLPQVHFSMGAAYYYKNNFKQAEEQFRLTLKYDPNFPKINETLGELLLQRQQYTEAIDYLKKGISKNPENAVNHHLLGTAYGKIDDWKKAHKEFALAAELDPEQSAHWQMCGASLIQLKRFSEAEPYLHKALELFPQSIETLIGLSQVLSAKGEIELAMECLNKALGVDPKNVLVKTMQWKLRSTNRQESKNTTIYSENIK